MRTRYHVIALFLVVVSGGTTGAQAQVDPQLAHRYFQEATKLCERDAGRLWGVSLCGPMVIFDQATGTRATSQPEPEGPPPRLLGQADGPVSWGGLRWFAFPLWMLPENDADGRQQNMLHGLFHRIQPDLGLVTDEGFNEHLDTFEGRVWMQLEWRALRRAVESSGSDRTGRSGPAYGVLQDDLMPEWRRQLRSTSDLGDLLASATNRAPTTDAAVAAGRYDGAALRTAEEARDRAQQVRVAELRQRFVDGPVLTMPAGGSGSFDTRGSVGIPGVGTVLFNNFTLSAQWGRLSADCSVLRAADGTTLSVPITGRLEGMTLQGDGWSATLNAGWVVRPAARPGSFTIVRER